MDVVWIRPRTELEKKIPDVSNLVKSKTHWIRKQDSRCKYLATKTALTAVENKKPNVSILVKNTDYNTKITEIENKLNNNNHDKYITTPEFNTLVVDVFNVRLAQTNFITKTDFDAKLSNLNRKFTVNKSKNLLVENELNKLKTFDSSYFIGKSHFGEDGISKLFSISATEQIF